MRKIAGFIAIPFFVIAMVLLSFADGGIKAVKKDLIEFFYYT